MDAPREFVPNFALSTADGDVTLHSLFGSRSELLLVHNMGKSCPYCTLWADGLNGLVPHFEDRCAFVVCSPDSPAVQKEFADSRNWRFRMVSDRDRAFTTAMGFLRNGQEWWPGVSAFVIEEGQVFRTRYAFFGPGDDFCPIWPMMDLLGGAKDWEPQLKYPDP